MKQTVVGLFNKSSDAQEAVNQLLSNGYDKSAVDLSIGSTNPGMGTNNTDFGLDKNNDDQESGVTKFFKNLFGDNDDRNTSTYSSAASKGSSIVTVHADSAEEAERAADILDDYGAINVDEDAEGFDNYNTTTGAAPVGLFNDTAGASASTPTADTDTTTGTFNTGDRTKSDNTVSSSTTSLNDDDNTGRTSIPIIEEGIQIGKRTVETGGVRIKSRIVERPVEENLRLREERVYVNRTPVDRVATGADFDTFTEGEMELREHAEVPVVSKEARVVEEVSLGKDVNERNETVRDTVRKTEVDIEDLSKDISTDPRKNVQ